MGKEFDQNSLKILGIMSNSSSFRILRILSEQKENYCVNEIAKEIGITPSAVSHQMSKLEKLAVVVPLRKGQMICYKLSDNREADLVKKVLKSV